jgi:hypothetical protein
MLAAPETPRFVNSDGTLAASSRAWRRGHATFSKGYRELPGGPAEGLDADAVAAVMPLIAGYRGLPGFGCFGDPRDRRPAPFSSKRLLVSRDTRSIGRLTALLRRDRCSPLTYFNGDAQARYRRNGLAGYEGIQEGLAVLEYLVGGMTAARLRLIAARCHVSGDARGPQRSRKPPFSTGISF